MTSALHQDYQGIQPTICDILILPWDPVYQPIRFQPA